MSLSVAWCGNYTQNPLAVASGGLSEQPELVGYRLSRNGSMLARLLNEEDFALIDAGTVTNGKDFPGRYGRSSLAFP